MSSEPLQLAYRLIREGNKQEAVRILTPIVRADPQNADAWWLLANAVDNPEQKRRALERVLRLRPEDERAQRMYSSLNNPAARPRRPAPSAVESFPVRDEFSTQDSEFRLDETADPFGVPTRERVVVRRQRRSPCGVIFAILAILAVAACGLCAVLVFALPAAVPSLVSGALTSNPQFAEAIGDVMATLTSMPEYPTFEAAITQIPQLPAMLATAGAAAAEGVSSAGSTLGGVLGTPAPSGNSLPTDLQKRGAVSSGETVNGTVDTFVDDSWTFNGEAGQTVVIELNAVDNAFDPQLSLYDPNGAWIAENDDLDGSSNRNSRIEMTLPTNGRYTIRVGAFGDGGDYTLSLN
jgi:hypothetical protein